MSVKKPPNRLYSSMLQRSNCKTHEEKKPGRLGIEDLELVGSSVKERRVKTGNGLWAKSTIGGGRLSKKYRGNQWSMRHTQ